MSIVSISSAARMAGKGRQTLYNHNKAGRLSFTKMEDGSPGVDLSELHRVYGSLKLDLDMGVPLPEVDNARQPEAPVKMDTSSQLETPSVYSVDTLVTAELDRLHDQLATEKAERLREREQRDAQLLDLIQQRDDWKNHAGKTVLALTDQREKPKRKKLFGII